MAPAPSPSPSPSESPSSARPSAPSPVQAPAQVQHGVPAPEAPPAPAPDGASPAAALASLENISLAVKGKTLLHRVDMSLPEGSLTALLGPNGAGKTTSIRCLAGVVTPTGGRVTVMGADIGALSARDRATVRAGMGIQSDTNPYLGLSAAENVELWGRLHGLDRSAARRRSEQLLEMLGLQDRAKDKVRTFSRGMRHKVSLAGALAGAPRLVVLDEPTSGLDPQGAKDLMEYIDTERRTHGTTVLLSSHRLPGLQHFASHATFIRQGRTIARGSIEELRQLTGLTSLVRLTFLDAPAAAEATRKLQRFEADRGVNLHPRQREDGSAHIVEIRQVDLPTLAALNAVAAESGGLIGSEPIGDADLEDIYFEIMKEAAEQ